ncbi:MAG TPA: hypothetical protein VHO71_06180 [Caproiciproducens sp.]|nr:hypothetical protein [Caproiciproducens sp.]
MPETIASICFVLLAVVGAADLVRWLAHWLLKSNHDGKIYLVIPVRGHEEKAEMMLSGALEKLSCLSGNNNKVICVDYGMDEETCKVCRILAAQNPGLEICVPDEISKILEQ